MLESGARYRAVTPDGTEITLTTMKWIMRQFVANLKPRHVKGVQ